MINNNKSGIEVKIEALLLIKSMYTTINKADRIKTVLLNTLIIESECLIKLKKLILDGPKYLTPLVDGISIKSFSSLINDPEKLFQVAFSLIIFSTVDFGRHVKFPNLIDFPVKVKVMSLCNS